MRRHRILLLFTLLIPAWVQCAELVVIVNARNPVAELSRKEVIDLYMGRSINFPNGDPALPLDQAAGSQLRQNFYQTLIGKSEANINAYWARLLFSGIASPPRVMPTIETTLQVVRENTAAIAYVDAADASGDLRNKRIKIVFELDKAASVR